MFFHGCKYKNNFFSELVYNPSVLVLMMRSVKDVLKDVAFTFGFEGLLLDYIAYSWRFAYVLSVRSYSL